ncbi:MAG: 7,8-didemethyl-8-hydroxy-5-deazariboflavin synthase [Halieaceae bacterium]|nr:7,8-didemethyl-8-hydroxy-5-deazariboflavin synthase [Halieaceae bacterium]
MGAVHIDNNGAPMIVALPDGGDVVAMGDVRSSRARAIRDQHYSRNVTLSPKVFIPVTQLCRDVCHYCTFAKTPSRLHALYLELDDILATVREGAEAGCREVLLTLGEKPELRYRAAREWLESRGHCSTVDYVAAVAQRILEETGLLPHINAGTLSRSELRQLRSVSASMGLMLESGAPRLCQRGGPHFGSPDKKPFRRWLTLARAGALRVPMTTGLLVGIGETREERLRDLEDIRRLHERYGHIQEVIIQNFCPKPGTLMAEADQASLKELLWTVVQARLLLPPEINIQAPPNLSPGQLGQLIDAGINDWGGVSPVTPDYVNPEAPWPSLNALRAATQAKDKHLVSRLTVYPQYLQSPEWIDSRVRRYVLQWADAEGFVRGDDWRAGVSTRPPAQLKKPLGRVDTGIAGILDACLRDQAIDETATLALFSARDADMEAVCQAADELRQSQVGDAVTYVVNRNINYTNVCQYSCRFCAFSKGGGEVAADRAAYDLDAEELHSRVIEAAEMGATEVCLQGGIHPDYTGQTYVDIVQTVRRAAPRMHIHAFSPLEIDQGAKTLGMPVDEYLGLLKTSGLDSLPGTAAEVLDAGVRRVLCPDKVSTDRWLEIMAAAHKQGLFSTATIMFGHVDSPAAWVRHWRRIIALQEQTGGFSEVVPLPFVAAGAPIFRKGEARPGPTWREARLMHAVTRLIVGRVIPNVQASWVKLGHQGAIEMLSAGANDLGGVLINESITRAAGAAHGQMWSGKEMRAAISGCGRHPQQRNTRYEPVEVSMPSSLATIPLHWVTPTPTPAGRRATPKNRAVI